MDLTHLKTCDRSSSLKSQICIKNLDNLEKISIEDQNEITPETCVGLSKKLIDVIANKVYSTKILHTGSE